MHLVLARRSGVSKPLDSTAVESRSVNNRHMCLKLSPVFQPAAATRARTPHCPDVKLSHLVLYDNHAVIAAKWLLKCICVCVGGRRKHNGALLMGVSDYLGRGSCVMSCQIIYL